MKSRLNLGCGTELRPGYINVDDGSMWNGQIRDGAVIHNLNVFPWPFADESAQEILMWNVIEHLPDTGRVMSEVRRILEPGGIFWGQTAYGPSHLGRTHWQHYRWFVARSFEEMSLDFGLQLVYAYNTVHSISWKHRLRNLIPFRGFLAQAGWSEAFDLVNFKMRRS